MVDGAQALIEHVPTDGIEDDVGSSAVGEGLHTVAQPLRAVVHDLVGTGAIWPGRVDLAARSRDDTRAESLANLDGRDADAACGPG